MPFCLTLFCPFWLWRRMNGWPWRHIVPIREKNCGRYPAITRSNLVAKKCLELVNDNSRYFIATEFRFVIGYHVDSPVLNFFHPVIRFPTITGSNSVAIKWLELVSDNSRHFIATEFRTPLTIPQFFFVNERSLPSFVFLVPGGWKTSFVLLGTLLFFS